LKRYFVNKYSLKIMFIIMYYCFCPTKVCENWEDESVRVKTLKADFNKGGG